ncbi:hypothetical protein SESBI_19696 [Sesbania bispinosa]|nr:hypothetical protein SESBI_19696 [Sesbania bispinosa]
MGQIQHPRYQKRGKSRVDWVVKPSMIQEELELDEYSENRTTPTSACIDIKGLTPKYHPPTPILKKNSKSNHKKKRSEFEEDGSVYCNKCRSHSRDKIFILPLDHHSHNGQNNKHSSLLASSNGIFRSIVSKLSRKSPMSSTTEPLSASKEEQWKMVVAELSHKLVLAIRKRDEALLEAPRLMHSMAELGKKTNKLELYCHKLKFGLEECSSNSSPYVTDKVQNLHQDAVIQHFLVSVSEPRSCVRFISRSLTMQLRHMGLPLRSGKVQLFSHSRFHN